MPPIAAQVGSAAATNPANRALRFARPLVRPRLTCLHPVMGPVYSGAVVSDPFATEPEESALQLRLDDIIAMLWMERKVIVGIVVAAVAVAALVSFVMEPKYTARTMMMVSAKTGQEVNVGRVVDESFNVVSYSKFQNTQVEILRSSSLRMQVVDRYRAAGFEGLDYESAYKALLGMMTIKVVRDSELIEIGIEHSDPEKAAILANLCAEVYRDSNLEAVRTASREAMEWLGEQMARHRQKIDDASGVLREFQENNEFADVEERITTHSARLANINSDYGEIQSRRIQQQSSIDAHLRMLKAEQYEALTAEMGSPLVEALEKQWADGVTNHASVASRYGEKHNEYVRSKARLDGIREALHSEVLRNIDAEKARLDVLKRQESDLEAQSRAANIDILARQELNERYTRLQLDVERSQELYKMMQRRYDELDLAAATQLNNVRIIDPATPPGGASSPNVPLNLALGAVVGLMLGVGVALGREYMNDTIGSSVDVSTYLKVPFLGAIPKLPEEVDNRGEGAMYAHTHPRSLHAEAYRAIRTVLQMHPQGPFHRLLVTSASVAEGKTSTTISMGTSFAQLGKRVVVVDGDLRRPRVHSAMSMERVPGFTDALDGVPLDECITASQVDGLFTMSVGTKSFGGRLAEELASDRTANILAKLDERFDLVLIDTPPTGLVADAAILSRLVDGVVFVARAHTVSRYEIRQAIEGMQKVNGTILGVVVNAIDPRRSRGSYRYGYGGYGYGGYGGYGYGYGDKAAYGDPDVKPEPA